MFRFYFLLAIIFIAIGNIKVLKGQTLPDTIKLGKKQVYINVKYNYGIVIPHHARMAYLIEDYSRGMELDLGQSNFGKDNWEKYFNYPEYGVGFYYASLGNMDVFGEGYAVFPYVKYNIIRTPRFKASYKLAWGIGYVSKIYSAEDNPLNITIGSHFNAYIGLGLQLDYRILTHWSITGSWSFNHFSNAAEKAPNEGINITSLSLGLKYHFNGDKYPDSKKYLIPKVNKFELLTMGYGGRSQSGLFYNSKTYFSGGIRNTFLYHNNIKNAFGVGVDFRYYGAAGYKYEENEMSTHYDFNDFLYSSAYIAYYINMGDLALYFHLGAYITSGIKPTQPVYPRLGIQYNINKKLVANLGLKASFFASECLEFGIGYRFKLSK